MDRITPELSVAFKHYPPMQTIGLRRIVNGPVHLLARRQPAGRADPRAARLLGGLRRDGRAVAGAVASASPSRLDDRRRPTVTSGMDIWAMDVARYG
jgi:hypothetical protein